MKISSNYSNKMKKYRPDLNGAKLVAQATVHMPHEVRHDILSNRTFFLTVPVSCNTSLKEIVKVLENKVRQSFGFAGEKTPWTNNCCIGLVTCADFSGTRLSQHFDHISVGEYPHFHMVLFVPKHLAARSLNDEEKLVKRVKECLLTVKEVREACDSKKGSDQIYMKRVDMKRKSPFYTVDYATKADEKAVNTSLEIATSIYPYQKLLASRKDSASELDREVKEVAVDLIINFNFFEFPKAYRSDRKKILWLFNNL